MLKNIIILNGIDIVPRKQDLIERSLLFALQPISSTARRNEAELFRKFDKDKPYILGAIFDIIVQVLKIRPKLELKKTHRMSDAYSDMCAIAKVMGIDLTSFEKIFNKNKKMLEATYSEESPFVSSIVDFMELNHNFPLKGTTTEVFNLIKSASTTDTKNFPKSSSSFSRKLNQEERALNLAGYKLTKKITSQAVFLYIEKIKQREKASILKKIASTRK